MRGREGSHENIVSVPHVTLYMWPIKMFQKWDRKKKEIVVYFCFIEIKNGGLLLRNIFEK